MGLRSPQSFTGHITFMKGNSIISVDFLLSLNTASILKMNTTTVYKGIYEMNMITQLEILRIVEGNRFHSAFVSLTLGLFSPYTSMMMVVIHFLPLPVTLAWVWIL